MKRASTRWVYLIGSANSSLAKIGVSNDPEVRLADLQVGSPLPLVLLWKTPGGQGLESALHNYFAPYRQHGEWFDFGEENPAALVATAAVLMGFRSQPDRITEPARYRFDHCTACSSDRIKEIPEPTERPKAPKTAPRVRRRVITTPAVGEGQPCGYCGGPMPPSRGTKPRTHCSRSCVQRSYEARQVQAEQGPAGTTNLVRVLELVKQQGVIRQVEIVNQAGMHKGTVSKVVKRLIDSGLLVRQGDGALRAT